MQVNYSYTLRADVVLRMSPRSFTAIKKFEKLLNLSCLPLKQNALLSEYINIDNFEPCPLSLNIFLSRSVSSQLLLVGLFCSDPLTDYAFILTLR